MNARPGQPSDLSRAWLVLLLTVLLGCACAGPESAGPLWADPGVVRPTPARTRVEVEIHNRSGTARPLAGFALDGPDWDVLRIVDASLPRTIPAHDSVVVELELSPTSLSLTGGGFRSARASLRFASNKHEYAVPIEFEAVGPGQGPARPGFGLLALLLPLVLLLGAAAWPVRHRLRSLVDEARARPELLAATAAAFAGLLGVAGSIPLGFGLCSGRLAALVGPRELAQCRAGVGGTELFALPAPPGPWWWLVGLALAAAALAVVRSPRSPRRPQADAPATLALAGLRILGLTLLFTSLGWGLADPPALAGSPSEVIVAQAGSFEFAGLRHLPRWGALCQPLGFVLAFMLLALGPPPTPDSPLLGVLDRLERLVGSGLLVTLYLGGPGLPLASLRPVPLLTHGPSLAVELLVFVAELALVVFVAERLRPALAPATDSAASLVRLHSRWTVPLCFLQFAALIIWRMT